MPRDAFFQLSFGMKRSLSVQALQWVPRNMSAAERHDIHVVQILTAICTTDEVVWLSCPHGSLPFELVPA